MNITHAKMEHLPEILVLYDKAREFMQEQGNPTQWINYPEIERLLDDIKRNSLYICLEDEEIVGVFVYEVTCEEDYRTIDGNWLNEDVYGVVHRIASKNNANGVASYCLNFALNQCQNLKIDTHEANIPMRNLLNKLGFAYCGIITLKEGGKRLAFQKDLRQRNTYFSSSVGKK